jgi:hypothetical protein
MGAVFGTILSSFKSEVATALGGSVSELEFTRQIEKNDFRSAKDRYGVRRLGGVSSEGVTRVYTLDHDYQVRLTARAIERLSEDDIEAAEDTLYSRADDVIKRVVLTKAGEPASVLLVNLVSIDEPQRIGEEILVLDVNFTVRFREALTL